MRLRQITSWKGLRSHLPPPTVRVRLTALYSSLFLASAAALLCITDVVWGRATGSSSRFTVDVPAFAQILTHLAPPVYKKVTPAKVFPVSNWSGPIFWTSAAPRQQRVVAGQLRLVAIEQQTSDLHQLLFYSAIASVVHGRGRSGSRLVHDRTAPSPCTDDYSCRQRHFGHKSARTAQAQWSEGRAARARGVFRPPPRAPRGRLRVPTSLCRQRLPRAAHPTHDDAGLPRRGDGQARPHS